MTPLPINGDPDSEIYLSPAWYGLVPDANLGLMNPAGKEVNAQDDDGFIPDESTPRDALSRTVERVRVFHRAIEKRYKTPTFAHYGAQGRRDADSDKGGMFGTGVMASKNRFTWGEVAWEGGDIGAHEPSNINIVGDDGNGKLRTSSGLSLTIGTPDCPGDGTVPDLSGAAPRKAGIALSFAHGQGNRGERNSKFCYDHQGSYGDKHLRSLYSTMFAVIKIAQQAQWHKKESA
ncbi:hypothetical protein ACKI2N_004085 [Cupriavidus sp. 30B13]|uniref:hypothetical protein n=1 Tax=Cupriavidus sp. 30B13 TaxID=3384241 RepID=UPI003B90310B